MNPTPKPSKRFAEYVRKIQCDEWTIVGPTAKGDKVVIRHISGVTTAYCTHDGGNDRNGPRNFALVVQRACGCQLIEPRGRKRSRKSPAVTADPAVEASRRRHRAKFEQRAAERRAALREEIARQRAAEKAAADDRRRREIEDLMR